MPAWGSSAPRKRFAAIRKAHAPPSLAPVRWPALANSKQAQTWLERALAIDPDDTHIKYNGACMWAQMGEADKALDLLEKWAELRRSREQGLDAGRPGPRVPA